MHIPLVCLVGQSRPRLLKEIKVLLSALLPQLTLVLSCASQFKILQTIGLHFNVRLADYCVSKNCENHKIIQFHHHFRIYNELTILTIN